MTKMIKAFITLLGLLGYSALTTGIYFAYGLDISLMISGSLSLLFALRASSVAVKKDKG